MPTFVYLPEACRWINLDSVVDVEAVSVEALSVRMVGDHEDEPSSILSGQDREVFLKALSKLTPKELT